MTRTSSPSWPGTRLAGNVARPSALTARRKILYVDDDAILRRMAEMALTRCAYAVETAGDGEEALAILDQRAPDLLITDLQMPRRNGLELIRGLRQANVLIPVILASGALSEVPLLASARLGRVALLPKPFSVHQLVAAVRQAFDLAAIEPSRPGLDRLRWNGGAWRHSALNE